MNINPVVIYFVSKYCDTKWHLPSEKMRACDLTFVIDGYSTYYINNTPYELHSGEAIFIPSGEYRQAHTNGMHCVAFNFELEVLADFTLPSKFKWDENPFILPYLKDFSREWLAKAENYQMKCKAIFLLILYELLKLNSNTKYNFHIEQIKKYILDHLTEKICIKNIAELIGLNSVYCGALFKEYENCTIIEYINQMRINKALELLQFESFNISQIAYQTGFEDIYYFSRVFKQIKGVSPSEYRRSLKIY